MVEQLADLKDRDRSLFPGSFTIRALRDSRYHNTAYAIAELIDNSVEAEAQRIEILCQEEFVQVGSQRRWRISKIAVLDNGNGMDAGTLLDALKFGGGTRHEPTTGTRKIGKYGMGLPTSSMSQCKTVDVWTWQNKLDSVLHSHIDADEIASGDHFVPFPDAETDVPEIWLEAGGQEIFNHRSGTLVVWSNLDKIQWKTASALIKHTASEVGRIHRHYINHDLIRIRAISFRDTHSDDVTEETFFANDPLYLMEPSSTPEIPWNEQGMFEQWGDEREYTITEDGQETFIRVQYSIVKPEALATDRPTQNPGITPRGRHARHNIGVSVVREGREIILEDAFLREGGSADNPQNRWWGCEVEFFRHADELFGLDHNKQMVSNFTQAARTLARDDRNNQEILDDLGIDDQNIIYEIVGDIRDQTRAMMRKIDQLFAQKRDQQNKYDSKSPEKKAVRTATDADRDAIEEGRETPTETDRDREYNSPEQRVDGLREQYVNEGIEGKVAQQLAQMIVSEDLSYQFHSTQLDGYQMFNVRSNQGVLHINLNTDHPVYDLLKHIEGDLAEGVGENHPAFQASVAIRLLLSSWARMEDQTESRDERTHIQDIAGRWGRQVSKAINRLRERDG